MPEAQPEYDVYICFADDEDRDKVALPLIKLLTNRRLRVFFEDVVKYFRSSFLGGLSLRTQSSRCVVVILGRNPHMKELLEQEYFELLSIARDSIAVDSKTALLLVLHDVTLDEVRRISPQLEKCTAVSTAIGLDSVAERIAAVARVQDSDEIPSSLVQEKSVGMVGSVIGAVIGANLIVGAIGTAMNEAVPKAVDEHPKITVAYPEVVSASVWSSVDVFLYLKRFQDVVATEISRLQSQMGTEYTTSTSTSSKSLPHGCPIRITLQSAEFLLNPSELAISWYEPYNRFPFRISPSSPSTDKYSASLDIDVFADGLPVSSMRISIAVNAAPGVNPAGLLPKICSRW